MVCPCCVPTNPPDPCSVLIDGQYYGFGSFNPYEVIEATAYGLTVPGDQVTVIDGVEDSRVSSSSVASLTTITRSGCEAQQGVDLKGVYLGPSYASNIGCCNNYDIDNKHKAFIAEQVDETTCRLRGGVYVTKQKQPCWDGSGPPPALSLYEYEEAFWEWQCLVVNGVPGSVTVSWYCGGKAYPSTTCGQYGPAPTVTLTFAPP